MFRVHITNNFNRNTGGTGIQSVPSCIVIAGDYAMVSVWRSGCKAVGTLAPRNWHVGNPAIATLAENSKPANTFK